MQKAGFIWIKLLPVIIVLSGLVLFSNAAAGEKSELLKYEVTWNGNKAGHGDITAVHDSDQIKVIAQAVSDGMLKKLIELWSRVQASFSPRSFKPQWYNFHLKTSIGNPEIVDLQFDHKTNLVQINKQRGSEKESHAEKFAGIYDPITAVYLLRSKDLTKPVCVDIFDGKDRSRLFVSCSGAETVRVKAGEHQALCLNLRLVKIGGDNREIGTGKLWISNDKYRLPLMLTSSPIIGTVKFELVHAKL